MRTKTVVPGFKNSRKIRVVVDGVGIYMTVGGIANMFSTAVHQVAVWETAEKLVRARQAAWRPLDPSGAGLPTGIAHRIKVYDSAIRYREVDVQLDLV